jgi:putative ABC transport system ATP-binding protein
MILKKHPKKEKIMSLVTADNLEKTYRIGEISVKAIRGVNFTIEPAAFVSFVGPSGSGKSTLLNMIGCLDPPTMGSLQVAGQDIARMDRKQAARFRGEHTVAHGAKLACPRAKKTGIQSA